MVLGFVDVEIVETCKELKTSFGIALNEKNGNTLWQDAIDKEQRNNAIAFDIRDNKPTETSKKRSLRMRQKLWGDMSR